jgi:glycosyltransferase involved in cell wall biosynthesis
VLWRYRKEPCTGRECIRCQLSYGRPPQLWRHTGLLARRIENVDAFIALSHFSRDKHREFGFPREMEVLPGFVRDPGPPAPTVSRGQRPYFLFVGRLESLKGLDDVIDAFSTFPSADLVIAGEGSQEAALKARAKGALSIRFVGFQSGEALAALYADAQAVIASSRGYETFGLSVIEAFSRGVPVLARRQGSYLELVEGSGAGATFADGAELQSVMQRILDDPAVRQHMGAQARARFRSTYSEDVVLPQYLTLVERLLPRSAVAPPLAMSAAPVRV